MFGFFKCGGADQPLVELAGVGPCPCAAELDDWERAACASEPAPRLLRSALRPIFLIFSMLPILPFGLRLVYTKLRGTVQVVGTLYKLGICHDRYDVGPSILNTLRPPPVPGVGSISMSKPLSPPGDVTFAGRKK